MLSYQCVGRHTVNLLRIIFITRISVQIYDLYFNHSSNVTILDLLDKGWSLEGASLRYILSRSCDSIIPLLSLASCIALMSKLFHKIVLTFMIVDDLELPSSAGFLAGCLFVVICFQTRITSLQDEDRYWRLLRNLGLIVIVNLHALFKPVNDRLLSLSASRSKAIHKHLRVLSICISSIILPVCFIIYLWSQISIDNWTMAVTVFGFEIIFRMSVSLVIYTMCMINSFCDVTWNGLEDQIYYLKASCGMISYLCGISLFCNGTWVYMFEDTTTLRAISLAIHLYFNIWNQTWKGWKVFNKRRLASAKISHLRDASEKELIQLDDVCSICFQQLHKAKVTGCNHYFHGDCLTRWLYLQDTCPICCSTAAITLTSPTSSSTTTTINSNSISSATTIGYSPSSSPSSSSSSSSSLSSFSSSSSSSLSSPNSIQQNFDNNNNNMNKNNDIQQQLQQLQQQTQLQLRQLRQRTGQISERI